MRDFLSGGVFVAALVAGIYFLRFWVDTRERFFLYFTVSFWLIALERIPLTLLNPLAEGTWYVYLVRLAAFAIIVAAIVERNSEAHGRNESSPVRKDGSRSS